MAAPVEIRNASDTYAQSGQYAAKNYGSVTDMKVGGDDSCYGFITWGNPIPPKAKIIRATITLTISQAWPDTTYMYVQALSAAWSVNRLNWNNKPGVIGPAPGASKTNAGEFSQWEIDITSIMQSVANGQPWYGLRIRRSGLRIWGVKSTQAIPSRRPVIRIQWSEAPMPPTDLIPRSGYVVATPQPKMQFNFVDFVGNRSMAGYRLQIDNNADFSSPEYDSGNANSGVPECDLTGSSFSATAFSIYYWRVAVLDQAGFWSDFSRTETFYYTPPPQVVIVNPTTANPYVEDATPIVSWNLGGASQSAYQVIVYDLANSQFVWDTGRIQSGQMSVNIASGVLRYFNGAGYRVFVRSWDTQNRMAVANAQTYTEANRDFTLRTNGSVTPFSSFTVAPDVNNLSMLLTAYRPTIPDNIIIRRNGIIIETDLDPTTVQDPTDTTKYTWRDFPPGRANYTYEVFAVVNGSASPTPASKTIRMVRKTSWLTGTDGSCPVALYNPTWDMADGDISSVSEPMNSPPYLVTQTLHGETGTFSGRIVQGTPEVGHSLSSDLQRDNLRYLRKWRGGDAKLIFANESMHVFIYGLSVNRVPMPDGTTTEYEVSFSFIQVDAV